MSQKKWIAFLSIFLLLYFIFPEKHLKKEKCGQFPDELSIKYSYTWQLEKTNEGNLQLFSAFLDDREFTRKNWFFSEKYYTVRIIGMLNKIHPGDFYCQMWYDKKEPVVVKSNFFWMWNEEWEQAEDFYQPYLISCDTLDTRIPQHVSLVENKCDTATNILNVTYEKHPKKDDFVVCVKGLNFLYEDKSTRLVEWIELVTILGASKIHFYEFNTHPNMKKVLDYYKKENRIDITHLTLVGDYSNLPVFQDKFLRERKVERRLQEVLPFNDCLYRYLYEFKYVVPLDIDEVIVPQRGSWVDVIADLEALKGIADSYLARNVYFFDYFQHNSSDIPPFMHILRHVTRSKDYSPPGDYVKGFHNTERVLALYNHISLKCFNWWGCNNINIDVDLAQMQHYRGDCVKDLENCDDLKDNTIEDTRVWRFKDELIERVQKVLNDLRF